MAHFIHRSGLLPTEKGSAIVTASSLAADQPWIPALHQWGFSERRGRMAGAHSHAASMAATRATECRRAAKLLGWPPKMGARAGRDEQPGRGQEVENRRQRQEW